MTAPHKPGSAAEEMRRKARELHAEAARLEKAAHEQRPLPDFWRAGQKIRYITQSDWGWSKGDVAVVIETRPEYANTPAREYQVFYTGKPGRSGCYWTTPDDVELVEPQK